MNSNNENNNEGLNAVSLGSIGDNQNLNVPISDIPPIEPVAPVEPVDTLDVSSVDAINQIPNVEPVPQVDNIPLIDPVPPVEPVSQINYDIPNVIDTTPVFNDIGTVPPIPNGPVSAPVLNDAPPKGKKKKNKIIFVLVVVLALAAVGVGVYILLNISKKPPISIKQLKIEVGTEVSSDIKDYAAFNTIDESTCSLDTSEITDTNKLGEKYSFKIICGDKTYRGTATIVDTIKPEVKLKEVTASLNGSVNPADFIEECTDATECSYEFKDSVKVSEYLKTAASYHVPIIVKDEADNEVEVTGVLIVSEEESTVALVCTKTTDSVLETYKFGLNGSEFTKTTNKSYTFTLSEDEYKTFKQENENKEEVTYKDRTGSAKFDDDAKTITIVMSVTYEELNTEAGSTVPLTYGELKAFYSAKNFQCNIGY